MNFDPKKKKKIQTTKFKLINQHFLIIIIKYLLEEKDKKKAAVELAFEAADVFVKQKRSHASCANNNAYANYISE